MHKLVITASRELRGGLDAALMYELRIIEGVKMFSTEDFIHQTVDKSLQIFSYRIIKE